ncbi:MAG: hypothetical protein ABW128_03780 [Rhizorhabdus sp.]
MDLRQITYGVLIWAIFVYSLRKGSSDERLVAGGIIVMAYLSLFVRMITDSAYEKIQLSTLSIDSGVLLLLMFIALRSNRFWPLWMAAMQSLVVLAHLAPLVPHMVPWGYWRAVTIWSWPMSILLGFAIYQRHRDRAA